MKPKIVGLGNSCPKCGEPMQRCMHKEQWQPRPNQAYWFIYWDKCRPCGHIQLYEVAKQYRTEEAANGRLL